MKKLFIGLFLVIVTIIAAVVYARNTIAVNVIQKGIRNMVGQRVDIADVDIGIFSTDLSVKGIKVYNPEGYKEKILADCREVYVNYSLSDIIRGFIHLPEVRLVVSGIDIEKDKDGVLNIDHFKTGTAKKVNEKSPGHKKFLIDKMFLKIGKLRYKDYSRTPSREMDFDINLEKTFTDVSSAEAVISAVTEEAMGKLVKNGIHTAVAAFKKDEKIRDALKKGDVKALEKRGRERFKELRKQFFK